MNRVLLAGVLACSLAGFGCAASGASIVPGTSPAGSPENRAEQAKMASEKARAEALFQRGLSEISRLDKASAWTAKACGEVADTFLSAAAIEAGGLAVKATFNAGIARERCGQNAEAKAHYDRTLALSPDFHPANVHLILMSHRETGGRDIDATVARLRKVAIVDAKYSNVEALVALAMLSLERGNDVSDSDGPNDRARAVRFLQSALAVDDGYSPAMNGLALYYLGEARSEAGRKAARARMSSAHGGQARTSQAMELAALVCSQALQKDPGDAVIHNTYGLIQVELGNLGKAAASFSKARQLRPGFYEAEMNYAAVNLQFRGFAQAEEAYRAVLRARPDDYDARLGLALALRGQIQDDNAEKLVAAAGKELAKAKELAPDRPEAYYNEAILTQEYRAKLAGDSARTELTRAEELFRTFLQKAGTRTEYAESVKTAKERITEIGAIKTFLADQSKSGS